MSTPSLSDFPSRFGRFARYFAASLAGLVLDVTTASLLVGMGGVPIIAAGCVSLLATAVAMYFVHELWTFGNAVSTLSASRAAGTVASSVVALCVRTACLAATTTLFHPSAATAPIHLFAAAGVSFVVNYFLVRLVLGRTRSPAEVPAREKAK